MTTDAALSPRARRWAVLTVLLLAAFLRLYRIADLPPGDGYDPAWYGVDALEILQGRLPVYLPTNIGREVLFSYLVAATTTIVGIGPPAIHLAAALAGFLTIPATYIVAQRYFRTEIEPLRSYGGVISALALTVSFWHQHWSRYGVRAILVPLFTALTMWALARSLQVEEPGRRRRYSALSGLFLGLSLYTYQSARVLPFLVAAVALVTIVARQLWSKRTVGNLLVLAAVAALIFAPMGLYLVRHPGVGSERIDQTWAVGPDRSLSENSRAVWAEMTDAARVLAIEGDNEIIHNLPGRPALNPFLLFLLLLGALVAVLRIRRQPYWVLLLWIPAMSVTAFLSLGGQPTKRALGSLPAIAMLAAVGAAAPFALRRHRIASRAAEVRRIAPVMWVSVLALGFIYSAFITYRDYFRVWGEDPNLWTHFEGGRVAIGRYARSLPAEEAIYSSPEMPDHPSIVYNSGGRTDLKGYNGRLCTVVPAVTRAPTTYIIVQHEESLSLEVLRKAFPEADEIGAGPDYFGQPYFTAYRIPAGAQAQMSPGTRVGADWENSVNFLGYDASSATVPRGGSLSLTLYTQSVGNLQRDYVLFVHLMNAGEVQNPNTGSALWAQDDSEPCRGFYPTSRWDPGEVIRDTYTLQVPAEAPTGAYRLEMGFYTWPDFQRLTTTSGPTGEPEVAFTFGEIEVTGD